MPKNKNLMAEALIGADGALHHLAKLDADIAGALDRYGAPPDRTMPQGFNHFDSHHYRTANFAPRRHLGLGAVA